MDYQKQAQDFLIKTNTTIKIELATNQAPPLWVEDGQCYGLMYNVTITRENKEPYSFNFWDSIANKEKQELKEALKHSFGDVWIKGKFYNKQEYNKIRLSKESFTPTAYDVLACIIKYDPETFEDFCCEYGFDEGSRKAKKTFLAVNKEYNEINRLFGDVMEELREIN